MGAATERHLLSLVHSTSHSDPDALIKTPTLRSSQSPATIDGEAGDLADHAFILCGNASTNQAGYGSCVASSFDSLHVQGVPTEEFKAFVGIHIVIIVRKLDAYAQLMSVDSSSSLQVFPALGASLESDADTSILGSTIVGLVAGQAAFYIALEPSFNASRFTNNHIADLQHDAYVYFQGIDSATMQSMITPAFKFSLHSGVSKVCPPGYVLSMMETSARGGRPGSCTFCKPGTYSVQPLASAPSSSSKDPECFSCPAGGGCLQGGDKVSFDKGNWSIQDGMYILTSCPTGHKVVNTSSADDTFFSHDRQMCEVCGKGEECTTEACVSCSKCAPGFYKQAVSTEACAACPASTYREDEGASELSNASGLVCPSRPPDPQPQLLG